MATPARPHRRLVWKYVAVVGTLVAAAIVSVGISESCFSYEDSKRAVTEAEADKASSAAISIHQFIQELRGDLDGVAQPIPGDPAGTERERSFKNLFLRQRAISALTYLDATGTACVHAYSNEIDKIDSLTCQGDRSDSDEFRRATGRAAVSSGRSPSSQSDGRPHMSIAVAEASPGQGRHRRRCRPGLGRRRDPSGADRHRGLRLRRRCRRPGHRPHHEHQPRPRRHQPRGAAAGPRRAGRAPRRHRAWSPTDAIPRGRRS